MPYTVSYATAVAAAPADIAPAAARTGAVVAGMGIAGLLLDRFPAAAVVVAGIPADKVGKAVDWADKVAGRVGKAAGSVDMAAAVAGWTSWMQHQRYQRQ